MRGNLLKRIQDAPPRSLSPRMRGNLSATPDTAPAAGSIPAYAGEPGLFWSAALRYRVYPRVCGGTFPGG